MVLILAVYLFVGGNVHAGEPAEQLQRVIDEALRVLRDPKLHSANKKDERVDRLMKIVNPVIDYEEIAKRSLDGHWRKRTSSQQKEFVRVFRKFLEKLYSSKIHLYDGETVVLGGEAMEGEYARVDSHIVNKKGEKSSLVFKLRRLNGKWKVYDLVAKDISMIDNYRSQFDRVISKSSYEELVKKIKNKTESEGSS